MANARGQYGSHAPYVGAAPSGPAGRSIVPWLVGGGVLAVVGYAAIRSRAEHHPRLSAHDKEVRAWEAEFPGLPWYADQVKDSRQLDMWERARDFWEKTH
jgi:hypothetical protein